MINYQTPQLTAFVSFCLITPPLWAANAPSEQPYLQDFPVVLSASRLLQPLSEAPNAMTVIDRKMIVASGFRNIPDLFKLVPGMYVSYYSGNQAIVSYHGAVSQTAPGMQVLIDGRSVYLPPFNVVDWATLPITVDDIQRIEVIRGPAAASYGENSVHGVINIITRDAGAVVGLSVSHTMGNKGINDTSIHFGKRGEKLDYRMTLAYTADNGYDNLSTIPNNLSYALGQNLLNNTNDSNQARLMNYRAAYHPNGVDDIELQLGFNHDVLGVGFTDSSLDKPHDRIAYSNMQQIDWRHRQNNASEIILRFYHTQLSTNENYQLGAPAYHVATSMRTGRNAIELQHTLQTSTANRLIYGAGYREDQINGNSYYPPVAPSYFTSAFNIKEYQVFANDEWRFTPKLIINLGGMWEHNGMGNRNFSPRTSLNYHFTPQQTIRLGVSIAYRTPSLGERYANNANQYQLGYNYQLGPIISSAGLSPGKIISREIGYWGEFRNIRTSLDLRLFNDLMENMIYAPVGGGYPLWGNGMMANYTGVETTLKHSFDGSADLTFNSTTEIVNSNSQSSTVGQTNSLASSLPRQIVSMIYSEHLSSGLSFSTAYYFQTSMLGFDRGPADFQPTHRRADLRIAKSFHNFFGLRGEVSGVVQNMFNTDYTEYISTALFNRRVYVKVTLHL